MDFRIRVVNLEREKDDWEMLSFSVECNLKRFFFKEENRD